MKLLTHFLDHLIEAPLKAIHAQILPPPCAISSII